MFPKFIFFILLLFTATNCTAQKDTAIVRLEGLLEKEQNTEAKLDIIEKLAQRALFVQPDLIDDYITKGVYFAEQSRDRNLMVKAKRKAASAYLNGGTEKKMQVARKYALDALEISKKEGVSFPEKVYANMRMSAVERALGKATDGLKYNQEAVDIANQSGVDSLRVYSLLSFGNTQLYINENLKAFKNYIAAQEIAEKSDSKERKKLVIQTYDGLSSFYSSIENYDKAIDYLYKILAYNKAEKNIENQIGSLYSIASTYTKAKKIDAAKRTYVEVEKLADSAKRDDYKFSATIGLLNAIMESDDKAEGLNYLKTHPEIRAKYEQVGMGYFLDYGFGNFYSALKKNDSANYYYAKSMPLIEQRASVFQKIDAYYNFGKHLYSIGNYQKAISTFLLGKVLCDSTQNLDYSKLLVENLDSSYQKTGDFKNAFFYSNLRNKIKLEIDEKSKAKDVLALEIDAENKRIERAELEEKEETIKRHNWQYMAIIVSILALFILLAALGVLKVPIKWVKALGFISFIFLFEFIILLADNWIHHATHGEPWKVLTIKVVLIALLLPFHHWLEHKVIHYITTRRVEKV